VGEFSVWGLLMPAYTISELGPLAEATYPIGSSAYDVNNAGAAVGWVEDWAIEPGEGHEAYAAEWQDGGPSEVLAGAPPDGSAGLAINDAGEIVGQLSDTAPIGGFLYKDGEVHDLSTILGAGVVPSDINSSGFVCGSLGSAGSYHPFIYDPNGGGPPTLLDPLPGQTVAAGISINDVQHVVGVSGPWGTPQTHLFLYRDGQMEDLGQASGASAINSGDIVTGEKVFKNSPGPTAYRLDATVPGKPTFEDLGHSQVPGFASSIGQDINDQGVVVGYSWAPGFGQQRAFVHIPGSGPDSGLHDLQDLLVNGDGWELWQALGINNSGSIVGCGLHQGDFRGWLLRPFNALAAQAQAMEEKFAEAVLGLLMLGGGAKGGSGIGLLPHGRPVPIPPHEWKVRWQRMSNAERDLYVGAAVQTLASRLEGRERSHLLDRAATDIIENALSEIARRE